MIKFECETCFQEYKVRDDRAGQVLKCKACGEKMRVPSGGDDLEDDLFEEEYQSPVRPNRKKKSAGSPKKKKSGNSNNVINTIVGVCAFVVAYFVSYTIVSGLFKDKKNDEPAPVEIAQNENQETATDPSAKNTTDASSSSAEVNQTKSSSSKNGTADSSPNTTKVAETKNNPATKTQKWVSLVDPPFVVPQWPESSKLSIDLKNIDSGKIIPNSDSAFIGLRERDREVYRIDIWNLATGKKTGQLAINIDKAWRRSTPKFKLSADGKYLLFSFVPSESKIPNLSTWDVETGQKLADWEAASAGSNLSTYEICGSKTVFAKIQVKEGNKFKYMMKVWDLKSGKLIKEKDIEPAEYSNSNFKITPGGKYLISFSFTNKFMIYDLMSLEMIKEISVKDLLRSSDSEYAKASYYTFGGMNFSSDGKELGLLFSSSDGTSVWVVDLKDGKTTNGYFVPGTLREALSDPSYSGDHLVWLPNGKGWLLYGAWFVDRARREVLWTLKSVPRVIIRNEVYLTPNYLIAETATALRDAKGRPALNRKPKLVTVKIPEIKIEDSLAAFDSKSDAILGMGQEISIEVNVGKLKFGNADEVKKVLSEVMQERLEADGFKVTPNQPVVFKIEYQEQEGNKLQLTKRGRPTRENPTGQTATGKTLQTTAAAFKLSWISQKPKVTLWSRETLVNPRFLILRDASAEGAREKMFEGLQNRLMAEAIPYFIPKDKKLSQLPVEIKLPE